IYPAVCDISNIFTCRHKITCFNAQGQIIDSRTDFRSAGLELFSCTFSLHFLFSVLCKSPFHIFFLGKGERNYKRCFYYNVTVEILSSDWEEEQVSSPNILRLIYQGRFLHGNVTLGALKLPFGKTTVMHLVARETLPEPNSQGQRNREKTGESNCCVIL
uniref:Ubiquitin like 3 n=1 Tax=Taeniopygia guttata TaxID=59729 RepID=A0A674H4A0_TAEGU